jgi:hypothetical protein
MAAGVAVDQILISLGIIPVSEFESFQFVFGQMVLGPLPDYGWFGDVGVTIKGSELLGHRRKSLNWHKMISSARIQRISSTPAAIG